MSTGEREDAPDRLEPLSSRLVIRLPTWGVLLCVLIAALALVQYARAQGARAYVPDEGVYSFVGWAWTQGDWPYRDVWDHKGPLVYATTALRIAILGPASDRLAAQEITLGVLTALVLAAIGMQIWGRPGAALAGLLGVLVWTQRAPGFGHMSTPGSLIGLLSAAAIACALRAASARGERPLAAWTIAVGLCSGLAVCVKPNALSGLAVGLASLVWIRRRDGPRAAARLVGYTALGTAVAPVAVALLFAAGGALGALVDAVFRFNSIRGALMIEQTGLFELAKDGARVMRDTGVLAIVCAALPLSILAFARSRRGLRDGLRLGDAECVVPLWLAAELALLLSNGAYRHHVLSLLPAAALAATWLVLAPLRSLHASWAAVPGLLIGAPMLLALLALPRPNAMAQPWPVLAADLAARVQPDASVISLRGWTEPALLTLAERRSALPYIYPMPLYVKGYASDQRWRRVVELVEGPAAPAFVIFTTDHRNGETSDEALLGWVVDHLDRPLVPDTLVDETYYPSREALKRSLAKRYRIAWCDGPYCFLEHRDHAGDM